MKRELRFKELSLIRLLSNFADFIVRITTAFLGFGPWCFIWGLLARTTVEGCGVIVRYRWRPRLTFRIGETREHIIFGLKASASEAVYRTYSNIDYWVVSIYFGPEALGLYRAAYELVLEPVRFLSLIITNVAFPAFSRLKRQVDQLADQYISFTRQNFMVISLFVACILVFADKILPVLFKPEYAEAAWAARVLAFAGALRALNQLGPPLLDGVGKPGLTLRYQCFSATVLVSFFFLFAGLSAQSYGYNGVALAWAVGYPIDSAALAFLVFRTVKIAPLRLMKAVVPVLFCTIISCGAGYSVRFLAADYPQVMQLIAGLALMTACYIMCLSRICGVNLQSIVSGLKQ